MSTHLPDQAVFRPTLPEDIDWEPFPAFPPSARLAVVVGHPSEAAPYVVRVKLPSGVKLMPHRHHEDRVYTVMSGVRQEGRSWEGGRSPGALARPVHPGRDAPDVDVQ